MSAQTGRPTIPPLPPSSRRLERARTQLSRWYNDPNPVWMRELRQGARLQRTPVLLAAITTLMTLLIASIGGIASAGTEPAKVGVALFHTFFSLAFCVVGWVAPAVAASTIASERSSRTWEALLLTGLTPHAIARGKFLAALSYISLYVVVLVPVGALPFLFGGITATEVILAFVLLLACAVLAVAFGLGISSWLASPAVAIVVTLLVAIPLSLVAYLGLGVGLSFAINTQWPSVAGGPPVWLPAAYVRADFGLEYLVFLVLAPLTLLALPAWFLYEVTVANMSGVSDDRSSGIRRWFLVAAPTSALVTFAPALLVADRAWVSVNLGMSLLFCMLVAVAVVFVGEPLGPSRRVCVKWDRAGAGALRRFLGPGIVQATTLLLLLGWGCLGAQVAGGVLVELAQGGKDSTTDALRVVVHGGYLTAFLAFVVGFAAWARARATSVALPRVLLLVVLFCVVVGPWIAMAIAGVLADAGRTAQVLAAPSPTYVVKMTAALGPTAPDQRLVLTAGTVCAGVWAVLGGGLLGIAARRARRVMADQVAAIEALESTFRSEDERPEGGQ